MTAKINTTEIDEGMMLSVRGEIDLYSSPELRSKISDAVPLSKKALVLDLSGVSYMDSSGVATLVEGLRSAKKRDIDFILQNPSAAVMKVLQLSRLDAVFDIREA